MTGATGATAASTTGAVMGAERDSGARGGSNPRGRRPGPAWWKGRGLEGMRNFWLVCSIVLVAQFVGLAIYSAYLYRRFDLTDDFATYSQAWWLIGHGHLNPVDTIQTPTYQFWQSHFELAMWPIALLGRLWPHSIQLLWLQDAALVATEWIAMAWVAARLRRLGPGAPGSRSRWSRSGFLVVNPWWYLAASFDVHFETIGLPFVVLSAYSMWRGRTRTALGGSRGRAALRRRGRGHRALRRDRGAGRSPVTARLRLEGAARCDRPVRGLHRARHAARCQQGERDRHQLRLPGRGGTRCEHRLGPRPPRAPPLPRAPRAGRPDRWDRPEWPPRPAWSAWLTPWGLFVSLGTLAPAALNANRAFLSPTIAFQTLAVVPFVFVGTVMLLLRLAAAEGAARTLAAVPPATRTGGVPGRRRGGRPARGRLDHRLPRPERAPLRDDPLRLVAGRPADSRSPRPRLSPVPDGAQAVVSQGVIGRFAERSELYPLLAAPAAVSGAGPCGRLRDRSLRRHRGDPTRRRRARRRDLLVHREGAAVLLRRDGVTVLLWRPPAGVTSVVLP